MRVAVGVGCRVGCSAGVIEGLVRAALARVDGAERLGLFTIADKASEPGLIAAAERLGLALVLVSRERLAVQRGISESPAAMRRFGVPAVAEAAALAGAGPAARLIVPRMVAGGATCAVATA